MLRIPVRAETALLYRLWTTQAGLESWFLRQADLTSADGQEKSREDSIQAGDRYEWRWHGWPDDVVEQGSFLAANGTDTVQFSFGKAGNVRVTIAKDAGEQIIELVQDEIPEDENSVILYHLGCMKGWLFYLVNLKSIAEGGLDLRNRNESLRDVVNS